MKRHILAALILTSTIYATECKDYRVGIDIGHLPTQSGALSARGEREYTFNRSVALDLYYGLKECGLIPFFINVEEKKISLAERTAIAKEYDANLFVSIHHDSVKERYLKTWDYQGHTLRYCDKFSGYGLFVSPKNPFFTKSLEIAKKIGIQLNQSGFSPTLHHSENIPGERKKMYSKALGVYRYDNLVVLKTAKMPAILIEGGIIVNRDEETKILNVARMHTFTQALISGIQTQCTQ